MASHCINVDGVLLRVTDHFDAAEGSEDMAGARELVAYMREQVAKTPARPCHSRRCDQDSDHVHGPECGSRCLCGSGSTTAD